MNIKGERRESHTTTQQMVDAPEGAIYIWCNTELDYPRDLALHLGRTDLTIIPPRSEYVMRKIAGTTRSVVVDHAVAYHRLRGQDADAILYAQTRASMQD